MPLIGTRGAASAQGFGEFAQQTAANYIEDVFSTYLYTGNGGTRNLPNGLDLAGKGGMVWVKARSQPSSGNGQNCVWDTERGSSYSAPNLLITNQTIPQRTTAGGYSYASFLSNGVSITELNDFNNANTLDVTYASWTFRKQKKFFDIQTYTGTGSVLTVNHNLGSTPGCIIIKNYNPGNTDWIVYHRGIGTGGYMILNNATGYSGTTAVSAVTDTTFTIATGSANWNSAGQSYIAYIFAHDAGGFGATGNDNVITCGSFVTNSGGNATINLGYEPQWVMIKPWAGYYTGMGWEIYDNMRGLTAVGNSTDKRLQANSSAAEQTVSDPRVTATGFTTNGYITSGDTSYIYIAIRRGPMKTPTSGTSVFSPAIYTGNDVDGRLISSGFPVDGAIIDPRNGYATPGGPNWFSRLTGNGYFLQTAQTNPETNGTSNSNGIMGQDGITVSRNGSNVWSNVSSNTYVSWFLRRAPSFYDTVCYTGTGANRTVTHNLTVPPELIIVKNREQAGYNGAVYAAGSAGTLLLDQASAAYTSGYYAGCFTSTSATTFGVNTIGEVNNAGAAYIAYLFASCPGVSKVGSYTGTGATQTISCGFAARFVLIKRTDSTGNWLVWDTARGMVSGSDFLIALNNTSPETNADWVYTNVSGFQIVTTNSSVNANGGSYIYLAIA